MADVKGREATKATRRRASNFTQVFTDPYKKNFTICLYFSEDFV